MAAGLRALAWGTLAASRQPLVSPAILDTLKLVSTEGTEVAMSQSGVIHCEEAWHKCSYQQSDTTAFASF